MKQFLRPLTLLAVFAVFFSSCSKKDKSSAGSFTYDSKSYSLNVANYSEGDLELYTSSYGTSGNWSGSIVSIDFSNSAITEGTYTYKSYDDDDFDDAKNFGSASLAVDYKIQDFAYVSGSSYSDITAGSATVTKSGSGYKVEFSLTFGDGKTATGSYTGNVTVYEP